MSFDALKGAHFRFAGTEGALHSGRARRCCTVGRRRGRAYRTENQITRAALVPSAVPPNRRLKLPGRYVQKEVRFAA